MKYKGTHTRAYAHTHTHELQHISLPAGTLALRFALAFPLEVSPPIPLQEPLPDPSGLPPIPMHGLS